MDRQQLLKQCLFEFMDNFFMHQDVQRHLHLFNYFYNFDITEEEFLEYMEKNYGR